MIDVDGVGDPCSDKDRHLVHHTGEPQEDSYGAIRVQFEELPGLP